MTQLAEAAHRLWAEFPVTEVERTPLRGYMPLPKRAEKPPEAFVARWRRRRFNVDDDEDGGI